MKIESITIENLLSFNKSKFNFVDYNVIVGPNNSGKTNLLRILKMLTMDDLLTPRITQEMKHEKGKKSQVRLAIAATDVEIRMILQAMIDKYIDPAIDLSSWKNFTIVLNWQKLGRSFITEKIIVYFQNKTTIILDHTEHLIFYGYLPNAKDSEQHLDELGSLSYAQIAEIIEKGSAVLQMRKERIRELVASSDPAEFFLGEGTKYAIGGRNIPYNDSKRQEHVLELLDYMRLKAVRGTAIVQINLLSKIIRNSFIQIEETPPTQQQLTDKLFELKARNESVYVSLQTSFEEIFPGTKIRVEQGGPDYSTKVIRVTERKKTFKIEDAASGYLGVINILYKILGHADCFIFLDEPEIHLHPTKIKQMGRELLSLTEDNHNQIIVISHSPKFVDHRLLTPGSSSALIVVTKNGDRSLVASPENPTMELKPHLLEPDVFFANAVFLVEGSSDESVIRAISDNFGGVFDSYEITIVNCGGVKSMKPYIKLLKAYSIAYYGLADKEYDGESSVIKLDVDLETELQKTIPEIEETTEPKKIKLKAEDAYCYMTDLLKTKEGFEKLKKTAIWTSVKNAADKQGISPKIFDEKYN